MAKSTSPRQAKETLLAKPPPPEFVERLKQLGVDPLDVGRVIVSTWLPHHTTVLRAIQEMGLELQVVFNRAAVMVLPAGVTKATGMNHALRKLGLSAHEVVGVGDSENDHSFLERSECAATVATAVPSIRDLAAIIILTRGQRSGSETREILTSVGNWVDDELAVDPDTKGGIRPEIEGRVLAVPVPGASVPVVYHVAPADRKLYVTHFIFRRGR